MDNNRFFIYVLILHLFLLQNKKVSFHLFIFFLFSLLRVFLLLLLEYLANYQLKFVCLLIVSVCPHNRHSVLKGGELLRVPVVDFLHLVKIAAETRGLDLFQEVLRLRIHDLLTDLVLKIVGEGCEKSVGVEGHSGLCLLVSACVCLFVVIILTLEFCQFFSRSGFFCTNLD